MNLTKAVLISIRSQHTANIMNELKSLELCKVVLNWVKEKIK